MHPSRVLVFGAHHDDEIAMAGTIAALATEGTEVSIAIMTDGSEGYPTPEMKESIVEIRRTEAHACDTVLGTQKRIFVDRPDMALVNDKETLKEIIRIIRDLRPEIIFTHGPYDRHRDHCATCHLTREAAWQAGEPVAADLGAPWVTPLVLYYKGVRDPLPKIEIDVTKTAHKRYEALATQESQHTLFETTKEQFLEMAEQTRRSAEPRVETFWIGEMNVFTDFRPLLQARK